LLVGQESLVVLDIRVRVGFGDFSKRSACSKYRGTVPNVVSSSLASSRRDVFKVAKVCKAESNRVIERVFLTAIGNGFFFGAAGGFEVDAGERSGVEQTVLNSTERPRGEKAEIALEMSSSGVASELRLIAEVSAVFSPFCCQMFPVAIGIVVVGETPLSDTLLSNHGT
jgi:hypothetical protein